MKTLYREDIDQLTIEIINWLEEKDFRFKDENEWDGLINLIEDKLDIYTEGYRNYN